MSPLKPKLCIMLVHFSLNYLHISTNLCKLCLFSRNQAMCVTFAGNVSTVRMYKQTTYSCILGRDHSAVHTVVKLLHLSQIWAPIWLHTQLMLVIRKLSFHVLNVVRSSAIAVLSPCTGIVSSIFWVCKIFHIYHTLGLIVYHSVSKLLNWHVVDKNGNSL